MRTPSDTPMIPVSTGELLDKISILELKADAIECEDQLAHVRRELDMLNAIDESASYSTNVCGLMRQLREINAQLWEIEDEIRICERQQDFSGRFVELARQVYHTNDERARIKKAINVALGSGLVEEKSYA